MQYKIGQVAEKLGLTAHTLRYYDKEGLLPFVKKGSAGARVFDETDVEWLLIVECLKATGMSLKKIKEYLELCRLGDDTLATRLEMFKQQKIKVYEQMRQLEQYVAKIDFKIAYYEDAIAHGTANIYKRNKCLACERERLFDTKKL